MKSHGKPRGRNSQGVLGAGLLSRKAGKGHGKKGGVREQYVIETAHCFRRGKKIVKSKKEGETRLCRIAAAMRIWFMAARQQADWTRIERSEFS